MPINKVLLEYNRLIHLCIVYGCFHATIFSGSVELWQKTYCLQN